MDAPGYTAGESHHYESDSSAAENPNRFDDAEDDMDIDLSAPPAEPISSAAPVKVEPIQPSTGARGKPEAVAAAFAASNADKIKEQLESSKEAEPAAVVAEPIESTPGKSNDDIVYATPVPETTESKPPPKKKQKKTPRKSPASGGKKPLGSPALAGWDAPSVDDPMEPMTDVEYENLISLMEHFCRVPLLAEFSRPVTLLHPELIAAYSKIVHHPIDLGRVCRKIRRREYKTTREVQLDMWRIFSNCVKYHSHPSNKEAVPSFVSISLHLREFFEALWQEHMLASDPPPRVFTGKGATAETKYIQNSYSCREDDRKKRLIISGLTCLSQNCMKKSVDKLTKFLANQGKVDKLDKDPIFPIHGEPLGPGIDEDDLKDLQVVVEKLQTFKAKITQLAEENAEYTVEQFDQEIKQCYTSDVFENNPNLRFRVRNRLNRFVGKILVPINEANCRGVTQSSIWGCMAAAIWARESSKKPYWPALVLGIMAPDDQKEDWHWALTERNEFRLPESLRSQLSAGKRKAELALRRQSQGQADPQSFFLVEFLGTHEFIWVRETDIVESFEPEDDPNLKMAANKKKGRSVRTSSATVAGSKKYQMAVEEAKWALEEFEMQLQDACGETMGDEDDKDGEDGNYSYAVLCVSDEEADDAYSDEQVMTTDDIEEANELIATRGLIDFSVIGRKNAKKRAQALKKQKQEAQKKEKEKLDKQKKQKQGKTKKPKKDSVSVKVKEREDKKEQKELEKRKKKRARERDKALKMTRKAQAPKRRRVSTEKEDQRKSISGENLVLDKRARATAIVNGYLTRMAKDDEYRRLGLAGIMSIPAAMVDSSGLLGMSLAFRAAAGELTMPEESGDQEHKKPWDAIDTDGPKTSKERTESLEKQFELLKNEIKRVKAATATRLKLAEEAEKARQKLNEDIANDELAARVNPFKKKKKSPDSAVKTTDASPAGKSDQGDTDNVEGTGKEDVTPKKEPEGEAQSTVFTPSSFAEASLASTPAE